MSHCVAYYRGIGGEVHVYKDFTDAEKKAFLQSFIKEIQIYPEPQKDGRILKSIELNIPVYFNGQETRYLFPKSENTDECVVQLSKGNISSQNVKVEFSFEDMDMSRFQQGAAYEQIRE